MAETIARERPRQKDATVSREIWDTSYVQPHDRFNYFKEAVCRAFFAFSPEKPAGRPIAARVGKVELERGRISKIDATPHRVLRTKADAASIPGDFASLSLQLAGGLQGKLNGSPYAQKSDQVTLLDINKIESFEIDRTAVFSDIVLIFDKVLLPQHSKYEFKPLKQPASSALSGCLRLLDSRYRLGSEEELTHLFDAAVSLLIADFVKDNAFLEERCDTEVSTRAGIIQTIKDYVGSNLIDPDLSTTSVAAHFGISTRYVQKLFAKDGATLKSYMTNARLDLIRLDLLNQSLAHISSVDIALRWGFRDMTTFHRNFKHRFRDTPGQIRTLGRSSQRGVLRG